MTRLPRRLVEALAPVRIDLTTTTADLGRHEVRADSLDTLRHRLSAALYDQLHAERGEWRPGTRRELTDETFEARLRAAVPHRHTLMAASVGEVAGEHVVVVLDGVRVRLPVAGVDAGADTNAVAAGQKVLVRVGCVRPVLSPGFLLVDGSVGHGLEAGPVLRVYVNVQTAEAAPEVLHLLLDALEGQAVPYRMKITSVRAGLPRQDAAVVYLGRRAWRAAAVIAAAVERVMGRGDRVSAYAHRLGPGVSSAWEPADRRPGYRGLSFGEHRSLVISTALLKNAEKPSSSPASVIEREFCAAGIDPCAPFRDVTSPNLVDILTPFTRRA